MKKIIFFNKKNSGCAKNSGLVKNSGVTMIELLIVVAILGILLFLFIFTTFRQVSKGRDGKRKADLEKIKVAFEDYFNDNNCYPLQEDWVSYKCGSDDFKPYLNTIPCDPLTKELYLYIPSEDGVCNGYRILAKLENADDPSVTGVGCDPTGGCGYAEDWAYNYGVAQGTTVYVGEGGGGGPEPTGEPSNAHYCVEDYGGGSYRCRFLVISTAESWGCGENFGGDFTCGGECSSEKNSGCTAPSP